MTKTLIQVLKNNAYKNSAQIDLINKTTIYNKCALSLTSLGKIWIDMIIMRCIQYLTKLFFISLFYSKLHVSTTV